jgi:hypothetical protein
VQEQPRTFSDDRRRDGGRARGGFRSDDRPVRQDDRGQRAGGGVRPADDRGGRLAADRGRPFSTDRDRAFRSDDRAPRDGYRSGGGRVDERRNTGSRVER